MLVTCCLQLLQMARLFVASTRQPHVLVPSCASPLLSQVSGVGCVWCGRPLGQGCRLLGHRCSFPWLFYSNRDLLKIGTADSEKLDRRISCRVRVIHSPELDNSSTTLSRYGQALCTLLHDRLL
jgi:hypothetical protein